MGLFQSFFNKPDAAQMHSNDIAKIADGGRPSFGATSPQSFRERLRIERNRQHVGSYRQANMHHEYRTEARGEQIVNQDTPTGSAQPRPQTKFQEPQHRHNPYA